SKWYSFHFKEIESIQLPQVADYPYLRYPLQFRSRVLRDKILEKLISQGTGAALFYPCPLNELNGLREILKDNQLYPNAKKIADTLITLPVHSGVTSKIQEKIKNIILETIK
ncbi:MAG: DegT/DnrJ/EryC1/StrS family aminotransferase, partial [Desulfobacterota bacterium]|nr:DegT/DnrJ/EryC1/StrS family aminotransferase [Thermodesulfobacteriota bacterium]